MNDTFDVIIVGGGIVGLSAALAMSQRGQRVGLLDAAPLTATSQSTSRVYAINQASQQLFQRLGVWQYLHHEYLSPYRHMRVWDEVSGAHIEFDARIIGAPELGNIIHETSLKNALLTSIKKSPLITLFPKTTVTKLKMSTHCIALQDEAGHVWESPLLMVVDGAHSRLREQLNIPLTSWSYHQEAIVTTTKTEKPHQKTAYQIFTPTGPLAFLPLKDPHTCSIVWSSSPKEVQRLMALPAHLFSQALSAQFQHTLGACELTDDRYQFPLMMRQAKHYSGHHWLLMGDAAHTIHPLAGLGLNLGLADLQAWLKHFDALKFTRPLQRALAAYHRERQYEVWKTILLLQGLKTLFLNPLPPIAMLRGLGLRACNQLTPLKRWFIEQAAGECSTKML